VSGSTTRSQESFVPAGRGRDVPYRDDLAAIHDLGFGALAENAATVLLAELRRRGLTTGLVVELGCGSGRLSERAAEAGYRVMGIDMSPALVELACRRVPSGTFSVGSLLDLEIPPCVAVAAIGECLNYLFDPGNTARARSRLLRRVHRALLPGGVLLFDAAGPGRVGGGRRVEQRVHTEGDGWAVLMAAEEDRRRRLLTRRITTFRRDGDLYRRDHEVHLLRLLPPGEVLAQLRAAGFRARVLAGYGALRFPSGLTGFLARLPG
jgi:SAM-dependent methyltransferase